MKTIYIVELIIAIILFIIMLIAMHTRKTGKLKIGIIVILLDFCLIGHIACGYSQEEPIVSLKGEENVQVELNDTYTELGAEASYHKKDVSDNIKIIGQVNTKKTGRYIIEYKYSYGKNKAKSVKRIVTVKDTTPLKIELEKEKEKECGKIYLTFDDGPSLNTTPKILKILKEENVKATFFILNYDKNGEVLVKQIVNEGHSIGIHGYSHNYKKIYKSVDAYMQNLTKLQDKIKKSTGVTTVLTRFPGGSSNTISSFNPKIMTKLTKEVVEQGFRYYDWNVSSGDAGEAKNKNEVYKNVIRDLSPKGNNIVLMHDFSSNNKTVDALKKIIQYGKQNGYEFKAITNDTPMLKHRVNN